MLKISLWAASDWPAHVVAVARISAKELPIDDDRLAVEVLKRAQPEVAVLAQRPDADCTLADPLDEGSGGRDLIQRVVRDLEVLRSALLTICASGSRTRSAWSTKARQRPGEMVALGYPIGFGRLSASSRVVSAIASCHAVGRTRDHACRLGGEEDHNRRDILGLEPGHPERSLGDEEFLRLSLIRRGALRLGDPKIVTSYGMLALAPDSIKSR